MLFVTGITGHTGRWFLKRLQVEGYTGKIRCLVRSPEVPILKGCNLNIELVVGSYDDLDFLTEAMIGVETVLQIVHIHCTEKIVEAAVRNKVKWLICVHTTGRFSKYKSASEEYIRIEESILKRRNEIDITVLRPTMIYGSSADRNMWKLIDFLYCSKLFPMFGSGRNLMQPVHAKDLGNAYYDVLVNPGITKNKEYDLAGKEPIEYISIIQTITKRLNKNPLIIKLPVWFSILSARVYNAVSGSPKISVEQVMRMQEDKAYSYNLAYSDFGYNPVSFAEGIKGEIEEYLISKSHTRVVRMKLYHYVAYFYHVCIRRIHKRKGKWQTSSFERHHKAMMRHKGNL